MKVTSASFFIEEHLRIFARYQAPSVNFAETRSPPFGTNPGATTAVRWYIENSRINFSNEAISELIRPELQ